MIGRQAMRPPAATKTNTSPAARPVCPRPPRADATRSHGRRRRPHGPQRCRSELAVLDAAMLQATTPYDPVPNASSAAFFAEYEAFGSAVGGYIRPAGRSLGLVIDRPQLDTQMSLAAQLAGVEEGLEVARLAAWWNRQGDALMAWA